jgi:Zn-dependent protease/predicted transcriptional regulator
VRGSWRIATVAGIPIRVHVTFLAIPAVFALQGWAQGGLHAATEEVLFILAIFVCVALHELGHSLVALSFGIRVRDITLLPIGGVAQLERVPENPGREIMLALAGPLVNIVIAGGLFIGLALRSAVSPWQGMGLFGEHLLPRIMFVNLWLAGFNLLPSFPMDGGRVLRGVLGQFMPRVRATRIAATVGRGMAVLFGILGLVMGVHIVLIFIALFVYMGATAEEQQVRMHEQLAGLTARDAMIAPFAFLHTSDSLAHAVAQARATLQDDFPVFDERGAVGFISRAELAAAASASPPLTPVGHLVTREWASVPSAAALEDVVIRFHAGGLPTLGVEESGRVVGLINAPSIMRALELRGTRPTVLPGGV